MASLEELQLNRALYRDLTQINSTLPDVESLNFVNQLESQVTVKVETASESIISGEITGNLVMIDGFIRSKNFISGSSGWTINTDGSVEFNDGVFRGSLVATSINIPNTTTANSFHVDSDGNTWWGSNIADGYLNANAYVLNTGEANFNNVIINNSSLSFQSDFGDGNDGVVTISSNTTLTRDMFYTTLVVNNGVTLNTGSFRIFCTISLTNNGTISRNGTVGNNGVSRTAGTGGAAVTSGSIVGGVAGAGGGAGGGGGSPGSEAGKYGNNGVDGNDTVKTIGSNGVAGGNGGSYTTSFGEGGAAGTKSGTVYNYPRTYISTYLLSDFVPSLVNLTLAAGSGGGGGGKGGAITGAFGSGGGGGGGGGSGSNGGLVSIFAKTIINTGSILTTGGSGGVGGNGSNGSVPEEGTTYGGSGGGGGGGGNGGVNLLIYSSITNSGSILASGGATGTGGVGGIGYDSGGNPNGPAASGYAGTNGNDGVVIQLKI